MPSAVDGRCGKRSEGSDAARTSCQPTFVVVPYWFRLNNQWSPRAHESKLPRPRTWLVLSTAGAKRFLSRCVACGPCSWMWHNGACSPESSPHGCTLIRHQLKDNLLDHADEHDVAMRAHGDGRINVDDDLDYMTAMYRSTFCLQPSGDTLTRRAFYQSIVQGCIPVVFREDADFLDALAFSDVVPYRALWICISNEWVVKGGDVVEHLRSVPEHVIKAKQALLRLWAPMFAFPSNTSSTACTGRVDDVSATTLNHALHASFDALRRTVYVERICEREDFVRLVSCLISLSATCQPARRSLGADEEETHDLNGTGRNELTLTRTSRWDTGS